MNKLWIFGDSFGSSFDETAQKSVSWFWGEKLAYKLECTDYINYSTAGCSNEYLHFKLDKFSKYFNKDDYIILIPTDSDRKWFFTEFPNLGNFLNIGDLSKYLTVSECNAIKQYTMFLNSNPKRMEIEYKNFIGWVNYKSITNKWKCLILPAFYNILDNNAQYKVKGTLLDICLNEFIQEEDLNWWGNVYCNGPDKRVGHLCRDNHSILCEKIYNAFIFNKEIDLLNDFRQKILSSEKIGTFEHQIIETPLAQFTKIEKHLDIKYKEFE